LKDSYILQTSREIVAVKWDGRLEASLHRGAPDLIPD